MINMDTVAEAFTAANNDMRIRVEQAKMMFFKPEFDREVLKVWANTPSQIREAIYKKDPKTARAMEAMAKGGKR